MEKTTETLLSANIAVWALVVILGMITMTGCAAPLLLGVKEIDTAGGTKISFITGADFHLGANGVDTVDDNKGIKPNSQLQRVRVRQAVND